MKSLEELSKDEMYCIFEYLDIKDKLNFGLTSKFINNVSLENQFWKDQLRNRWIEKIKILNDKAKIHGVNLINYDFESEKELKKVYTHYMIKHYRLLFLHYHYLDTPSKYKEYIRPFHSIFCFIFIILLCIILFEICYKNHKIESNSIIQLFFLTFFCFYLFSLFSIFNIIRVYNFYLHDYYFSNKPEYLEFKPLPYKSIHWSLLTLWIFFLLMIDIIRNIDPRIKMSFLMIPEFVVFLFCYSCVYFEKTKYQILKMISYLVFYTLLIFGFIGTSLNIDLKREIFSWNYISLLFFISFLIYLFVIIYFEFSSFLEMKSYYLFLYFFYILMNLLLFSHYYFSGFDSTSKLAFFVTFISYHIVLLMMYTVCISYWDFKKF